MFSEEKGKLSAIAKGIKKITSKRAAHIQTGNLVQVGLSQRGDIFYLQDSTLLSAFSNIRSSDQKTNFLYTFFFVLDRVLPEYQPEQGMFNCTKAFLSDMGKPDPFSVQQFSFYLTQLLMKGGYVNEQRPLPELIRIVEEVINEKVPLPF